MVETEPAPPQCGGRPTCHKMHENPDIFHRHVGEEEPDGGLVLCDAAVSQQVAHQGARW